MLFCWGGASARPLQWLSTRLVSAADAQAKLLPVRSTPHRKRPARPCRRMAAMQRIFYGPINLAKALITRRGGTLGAPARREYRCLRSNDRETKINYIAIAANQYCVTRSFTGSYVHSSSAIDLCGP